jgi:hypothetical protein
MHQFCMFNLVRGKAVSYSRHGDWELQWDSICWLQWDKLFHCDLLLVCSTVRQQGQSQEKVNRAMILAPLVGIVLNLRNATMVPNHGMTYDLAHAIVSVDVSAAVISNFQYLINYSWVRVVMNLMVVMKVSLSATQHLWLSLQVASRNVR